jgi:hypothetical protein
MVAPQEHDYSVMGGADRVKVGRMLSLAASLISGVLVFLLLASVDVAKKMGWHVNLPPTLLSLVGASMVFTVLYAALNKWAWRWPGASLALKVPNISGAWDCRGETIDINGNVTREWTADIVIFQTWDKLRIRLNSSESGSNSISAALANDSVDGVVLLYHYKNDPKVGSVGLASHTGCCVMTIAKDGMTASGDYFTGRGRMSVGRMTWIKRN